MCLAPAPTHVTSFLAKFFMVILMRSNDKRFEDRIDVDMGKLRERINQAVNNFTKTLNICGYWCWTH